MEIRKSIEEWIDSRPNAKLCLHNGFAGFSYGCPSNPIFLDKDIESECLYGDAGLG